MQQLLGLMRKELILLQTDSKSDSIDSKRENLLLSRFYACPLYSDSMTALTVRVFQTRKGQKKIKKNVFRGIGNLILSLLSYCQNQNSCLKWLFLVTVRDSMSYCQNKVLTVKKVSK